MDRPAEWFLYECAGCGQRTIHGPEGGNLNECECDQPTDSLVTSLVEAGRFKRTSMLELAGGRWAA